MQKSLLHHGCSLSFCANTSRHWQLVAFLGSLLHGQESPSVSCSYKTRFSFSLITVLRTEICLLGSNPPTEESLCVQQTLLQAGLLQVPLSFLIDTEFAKKRTQNPRWDQASMELMQP